MEMKKLFPLLLSLSPILLWSQPSTGKQLSDVTLSGKSGGRVDGTPWHSDEISGKVYTLMYVDPDESETNEHVERALKKEKFPRDRYGSIAVVNTGATWKPDSMIRMVLKGKQKDYPDSVYVMDRDKVLVKKWKLADDNYHVLTFDASGRLIYQKAGKLSDTDIRELVQVIRANL